MAKADSAESARPTGPRRLLPTITPPLMLLLALWVRLFDLTDPPLDFHPTRQLRSAMIARGMYYAGLDDVPEWQRELAARQQDSQEALEPTILETLVAFAYRLAGGERLWLARLFSSLFWVAGGLALYGLGKDLSSHDGPLVGMASFLLVGAVVGLLIARGRLRAAIRDPKAWALIVVSLLPVTLYYVRGIFIT